VHDAEATGRSGCACGDGHETAPEAGQQVDAGEPGPFAVGLEQLRRLPALDPAPAQRGEQLDESEVADEAVLAATQALEADDARRPRAESTLAHEARDDGFGGEAAQPLRIEGAAEPDERRGLALRKPEPAQLEPGERRERRAGRRPPAPGPPPRPARP